MLVLIRVKTGLYLGPWANEVIDLRNAVVNTRQKKVNTDYHSRAKSLDARGGDTRDGFEAELSSYGQGGRVLGPVVGAFGEMSDDVKELANTVAEEFAVEHCSFYGEKAPKAVKGFFLNQLYCSWGHTAHRGWARLLLAAAVWCRFPMPHAAGHAHTIGTTRKISWRAISTRRSITTLAQVPR